MSALDFEDILRHAGDRGRWQWMVFVIASLSGFFNAFHHLGSTFLGAEPDHWCARPASNGWWTNLTEEQWRNVSAPSLSSSEAGSEEQERDKCRAYDVTQMSPRDVTNARGLMENATATIRSCDEWEFNRSGYASTIVTEWNLICDRKYLLSTVQSTYMAGVFVGCFSFGLISDRFGRRVAFLTALGIFTTSGIITSFSVSYIMFIVFRFVIAMCAAGLFTSTYVLTTEIADPELRCMFGIFFEIPFAMGYMALSGVAYLIRDWRDLQLAISVPSILMISFVWLLPESPRWLISKGQFDLALKVLKKVAKFNRKTLPSDEEMLVMMKICMEHEEQEKNAQLKKYCIGILFDLFRHPSVLRRVLTVYFTWFVVAMVYYGLAMNARYAKEFNIDVYLMNFLNGLVEIPAYIMVYVLISHGGRRIGYCGTFLSGGFACLLLLAFKDRWVVLALAVLGKFFVTATFAIAYLFTAELFPTSVRNVAVNSSSMCGRVGSMLAPYVVDLLPQKPVSVPMGLFGGLAVTAGILSMLLPETNKKNMVENLGGVLNRSTDANLESNHVTTTNTTTKSSRGPNESNVYVTSKENDRGKNVSSSNNKLISTSC